MKNFIKKLGCLIGIHEWRAVSVYHYYDTSWGDRVSSTAVTFKCGIFGKIKVKNYYGAGFLELNDLQ